MYFDTLTVTENLITAGMPDDQAKAIAREYANWMQHQVDQFATKDDIKLLRKDLQHVNDNLKTEIQHVRSERKGEIQQVRVELKHMAERLNTKLDGLMWRMIFNMWGISATVASLLFAAMRLF